MDHNTGIKWLENYSGHEIIDLLAYGCYLKEKKQTAKLGSSLERLLISKSRNKNKALQLSNFEKGSLLYLIAEYTRLAHDRHLLVQYQDQINLIIDDVQHNFRQPEKNIFNHSLQINTSTLGALYSGLKNINNYLKKPELDKIAGQMKQYVFAHHLKGNVLGNGDREKAVTFDILLACVPFAMFEPEDLVLVEAVKILKQRAGQENDSRDLLLLAWYYAEQGSCQFCRQLLKKAAANGISHVFPAAIYQIICSLLTKQSAWSETMIFHNPPGHHNIYEPGVDERFPKNVKPGQKVILKATCWPMHEKQELYLCYQTDGVEKRCKGSFSSQPRPHYAWEIGPFAPLTEVNYYFYFKDSENRPGEKFSFTVLKKIAPLKITAIDLQGPLLCLDCRHLFLYLAVNQENNITFSINEKPQGNFRPLSLHEKKEYYLIRANEKEICLFKNMLLKVLDQVLISQLTVYMNQDQVVKEIEFSFPLSGQEKFYGFGERYNTLNQRGNSPDLFVYNQYKDQGLRTYLPVAFFFSSRNYGFYFKTSHYMQYDLGKTEPDQAIIRSESSSLLFNLYSGRPEQIIQDYIQDCGQPLMLPKWAFGPWMSSNNWDSQAEVLKQAALTQKHAIPATVIVIEQWSDEATYYIFNDASYGEKPGGQCYAYRDFDFPAWGRWPDPKKMIDQLHRQNLKCILWQIPILKRMNGIHHIRNDQDEQYALENKLVVENSDGSPYRIPEGWFKDCLLLDFSNPRAVNWWFAQRSYLVKELLIDGFKTDGGEFVFGQSLKFYDGRRGAEMRNEYTNDYVSAYWDYINQNRAGGGITFSRAGYTGAQKFPAHWAGDERSTFAALRRSLVAGLSAGLSGIPFWGWDLAGFSGEIPTAELYIRSAQLACFCPIMQYHAESKAESNQDRTPWNIAEQRNEPAVITLYRYYANLRLNLLPYIYDQALKSSASGLPLMRAMLLDFFRDSKTHLLVDQYLFGEQLLAAPVLEEGATQRSIYLPEGSWYDFFSLQKYQGRQTVTKEAGREQIPVFIKENSIIALNLNRDFQIAGNIHNDLSQYIKLCFLIIGHEIDFTFKDDLKHNFHFKVKNREVMLETNYEQPYYLLSMEKSLSINQIPVEGQPFQEKLYLYRIMT